MEQFDLYYKELTISHLQLVSGLSLYLIDVDTWIEKIDCK